MLVIIYHKRWPPLPVVCLGRCLMRWATMIIWGHCCRISYKQPEVKLIQPVPCSLVWALNNKYSLFSSKIKFSLSFYSPFSHDFPSFLKKDGTFYKPLGTHNPGFLSFSLFFFFFWTCDDRQNFILSGSSLIVHARTSRVKGYWKFCP